MATRPSLWHEGRRIGLPGDQPGTRRDGVWTGVRFEVEAEADRLIFAQTSATSIQEEKKDVLTPHKVGDRICSREILVSQQPDATASPSDATWMTDGAPDRVVAQGSYGRAANGLHSHLNGHLRGITRRVTLERSVCRGSGPIFGASLNTPSLYQGKGVRLPDCTTGVPAQD